MMRRDQPDHRASNYVGARRPEVCHLVDRPHRPSLALRCIDHAIGAEVYQGANIVGSQDARRMVQPAELSRIPTDLLRTCGMYADQFQIWPADNRSQRMPPHVASGELDYSAHRSDHLPVVSPSSTTGPAPG